ncbi:uncharacterized protein (DUF924 family) [Bradyrhizobium liaoningense]|nr:hypothetical protein GCM10007858_38050 [Bradyrhizobium liaoningense]
MTDVDDISPSGILAFWREAGRERWYARDEGFDAEIRRRFLGLWHKAAAGELAEWETSDEGALALVILLDQFPRNMFRGPRGSLQIPPGVVSQIPPPARQDKGLLV